MKRSRTLFTLLPVALTASLLASCSAVDGDTQSGTGNGSTAVDCAPEGEVSSSLQITGDFGGELTLENTTPIEVTALERSVLIEGEGVELEIGDIANAQLTVINATTGELIESSPSQLEYEEAVLQPWAFQALHCSSVGDRVAVAAPVAEVLGAGNAATYGLEETDNLVLVFDVSSIFEEPELLEKAEGEAQEAPAGLPEVELDDAGAPTITMPEGVDAPTSLTVATLIKGEGAEVKDGDTVYVHYRGVIWRTGEEFDSSWSRGEPTSFSTNGVIRGFQEALVGQTVGSQVISVVPAEDGGYGAATLEGMGHEPDDVMVFVLDILGVVPAA